MGLSILSRIEAWNIFHFPSIGAQVAEARATCVNRFNRSLKAGVWEAGVWAQILEAVSAAYDGDIHMIDGSSI